jgi:hypothetical protein
MIVFNLLVLIKIVWQDFIEDFHEVRDLRNFLTAYSTNKLWRCKHWWNFFFFFVFIWKVLRRVWCFIWLFLSSCLYLLSFLLFLLWDGFIFNAFRLICFSIIFQCSDRFLLFFLLIFDRRMFGFNVFYELIFSIIFGRTWMTRVRFIICMTSFMIFTISYCSKSFRTMIAFIWFFTSVRSHMYK